MVALVVCAVFIVGHGSAVEVEVSEPEFQVPSSKFQDFHCGRRAIAAKNSSKPLKQFAPGRASHKNQQKIIRVSESGHLTLMTLSFEIPTSAENWVRIIS